MLLVRDLGQARFKIFIYHPEPKDLVFQVVDASECLGSKLVGRVTLMTAEDESQAVVTCLPRCACDCRAVRRRHPDLVEVRAQLVRTFQYGSRSKLSDGATQRPYVLQLNEEAFGCLSHHQALDEAGHLRSIDEIAMVNEIGTAYR